MNKNEVIKNLLKLAKECAEEEKTKEEPKKRKISSVINAALTKKYFIEIGKMLREHAKDNDDLINAFVEFFKQDNPNFDVQKFIEFINK